MKIYAFWKYDLFPYVLWAEVEKLEDSKFYLKNWQGSYRTANKCLAILSEKKLKNIFKLLLKLKSVGIEH